MGEHHPLRIKNEIRKRWEMKIVKPLGWCRDERLRLGMDEPIMRVNGHLLVYCVKDMHRGCWVAWKPSGELLAIGSAAFVRAKMHGRHYPWPSFIRKALGRPA